MSILSSRIPENNNQNYKYARLTASGLVKTGVGQIWGFVVATGTPTITIYDNTSAAGTLILNGIVTVAGGTYQLPVGFGTGCYVSISGACDVTFLYN